MLLFLQVFKLFLECLHRFLHYCKYIILFLFDPLSPLVHLLHICIGRVDLCLRLGQPHEHLPSDSERPHPVQTPVLHAHVRHHAGLRSSQLIRQATHQLVSILIYRSLSRCLEGLLQVEFNALTSTIVSR
jgi:hypothetical protein